MGSNEVIFGMKDHKKTVPSSRVVAVDLVRGDSWEKPVRNPLAAAPAPELTGG